MICGPSDPVCVFVLFLNPVEAHCDSSWVGKAGAFHLFSLVWDTSSNTLCKSGQCWCGAGTKKCTLSSPSIPHGGKGRENEHLGWWKGKRLLAWSRKSGFGFLVKCAVFCVVTVGNEDSSFYPWTAESCPFIRVSLIGPL